MESPFFHVINKVVRLENEWQRSFDLEKRVLFHWHPHNFVSSGFLLFKIVSSPKCRIKGLESPNKILQNDAASVKQNVKSNVAEPKTPFLLGKLCVESVILFSKYPLPLKNPLFHHLLLIKVKLAFNSRKSAHFGLHKKRNNP